MIRFLPLLTLTAVACSSANLRGTPEFAAAENTWKSTCAACHGPHGSPPPEWADKGMRRFGTTGMSMGFFFGGDKMRRGIAATITQGKGTLMPAFKDKLTPAEIDNLVRYIEAL